VRNHINRLLCALLGHKWIPFQNNDRWGFCKRCGKFSPTMLKETREKNYHTHKWWKEIDARRKQ